METPGRRMVACLSRAHHRAMSIAALLLNGLWPPLLAIAAAVTWSRSGVPEEASATAGLTGEPGTPDHAGMMVGVSDAARTTHRRSAR